MAHHQSGFSRWGTAFLSPFTIFNKLLEGDLVDDAESDQCGQGEGDADGEEVDIDGQLMRRFGLSGAGWFGGCHVAPCPVLNLMSLDGCSAQEKAHVSRFALNTWAPEV
jgi:hypothetical protein